MFRNNKSISYILVWQTAGKFLLQGISFFTIPIFTRLLTPSDYGQVAVYSTWVSMFSLIVGLQTGASILNAGVKYGNIKINGYLSSIMTISIISFILVFLFSIIFNNILSGLLLLRADLVILLSIHSFASFCVAFFTNRLIQQKHVELNFIISLIVSISGAALSILFITATNENKYIAKIYGAAIPIIIAGSIVVFYIYYTGRMLYNKEYWNYCLAFTLPLILHSTGNLILAQSDRIMLQRMKGLEETGLYSFAYGISTIVQIIWLSFGTSWGPFYYEYKKNNKTETILIKSKNYIIVFSIIVMIFILLVPEVYKIMSPIEYWPAIQLIPLISLACYMNFLYSFPTTYEFFSEKTKLISIGTILAALVNIICNFIFIPPFGGIGAAIATLIAYLFLFIFHDISARFIIKNYEYKFSFYLIGLIPVIITVIFVYFFLNIWIVRWIIGITLGAFVLRRIVINKAII
jgi:O-antigen/teichoic acid export membrane protein